jgi:alkanesulfonate monooxygenase SsuD/methylene tetrahydromethanopterin reductase-like flavin-dependent oxidoreductase (luciferase family)
MRVGVTLPHFVPEADRALTAARRAEQLGLDGVFCFDHLWPLGQPGRPALSPEPLLGAVAASTTTIAVGTLVARIGLVADERLVSVLTSLSVISGGRFIAGIGTGDRSSRDENLAFGVWYESADERRARLAAVARAVLAEGIPVWVGGGAPKTTEVARRVGAATNLWGAEPIRVAELAGTGMETTWGGPVGATTDEVSGRLLPLADAGATWAVCAWPSSLEAVAEAAEAVRRS